MAEFPVSSYTGRNMVAGAGAGLLVLAIGVGLEEVGVDLGRLDTELPANFGEMYGFQRRRIVLSHTQTLSHVNYKDEPRCPMEHGPCAA
jgi:hypothetical protein